jgi:hypothetical protein
MCYLLMYVYLLVILNYTLFSFVYYIIIFIIYWIPLLLFHPNTLILLVLYNVAFSVFYI